MLLCAFSCSCITCLTYIWQNAKMSANMSQRSSHPLFSESSSRKGCSYDISWVNWRGTDDKHRSSLRSQAICWHSVSHGQRSSDFALVSEKSTECTQSKTRPKNRDHRHWGSEYIRLTRVDIMEGHTYIIRAQPSNGRVGTRVSSDWPCSKNIATRNRTLFAWGLSERELTDTAISELRESTC